MSDDYDGKYLADMLRASLAPKTWRDVLKRTAGVLVWLAVVYVLVENNSEGQGYGMILLLGGILLLVIEASTKTGLVHGYHAGRRKGYHEGLLESLDTDPATIYSLPYQLARVDKAKADAERQCRDDDDDDDAALG